MLQLLKTTIYKTTKSRIIAKFEFDRETISSNVVIASQKATI